MTNVAIINHGLSNICGIHAHGVRAYNILKQSKTFNVIYLEVTSLEDCISKLIKNKIDIAVYNSSSNVIPWAQVIKSKLPNKKHIGMIHDITEEGVLSLDQYTHLFDRFILLDPTLPKTTVALPVVRPLFNYRYSDVVIPEAVVRPIKVGLFGFFFFHKNFDLLITRLLKEEVKVVAHITEAHFSDESTKYGYHEFAKRMLSLDKNKILFTNNRLSDNQIIDLLHGNDINLITTAYNYGMGPASTLDYYVAAGKPIMISDSYQFRHVKDRLPLFSIDKITNASALSNDNVLTLQKEWAEEKFLQQHEDLFYELQN